MAWRLGIQGITTLSGSGCPINGFTTFVCFIAAARTYTILSSTTVSGTPKRMESMPML
jgi:hypothetical protein